MEPRNQTWWQRRTSLERRLMRFLLLLVFLNIALIVALGVILSGRRNVRVERKIDQSKKICLTSTCNNTAMQMLQDMDLTEEPCDNFYQFACGGFLNNTKIPEDGYMIDFFTINLNVLSQQLKALLEKPVQPDEISPFILLKKFYKSCMNINAFESNGLRTINGILKQLGGWPVLEGENWNAAAFNWIESVFKLRQLGIDANYLIDFNVEVDEKNTTRNIIRLDQVGLGFYEAYLWKGQQDKRVQTYYNFMVDVAVIMGATREEAEEELNKSLNFEISLSSLCLTYKELRNMSALYNLMTISELQQKYPSIPWLDYITKALNIADILVDDSEIINVIVPNYIKGLEELLSETPTRVLANYFLWRVVQFAVPYLTEELRHRNFEFDQAITGMQNMKSKWRECMKDASDKMKLALAAMYGRDRLVSDIKQNVYEIVHNIKTTFIKLLEELKWMDEETKIRAIDKANAITTHVAFPDELFDDSKLVQYYSKLEIPFENYFESILKADLYDTDYYYGQLRKPFNKTSWINHAFPTEVDAYYTFAENSIRFSTGLLQGVVYNKNNPQYMNYGGLGFLVGHEITHGFDVQGSAFDKNGNLFNWWNKKTKEVFEHKTQCIIDQYANYYIPEIKMNLNGINNQEENIADNGGARVAYLAYKAWSEKNAAEYKLPGLNYTQKQMFWIATAHAWCGKYRDGALKKAVATDTHAPNSYRILGSFRNLEYFSEDFNCPLGSNMNPRNKCRVW